jgi:hypothetical protein
LVIAFPWIAILGYGLALLFHAIGVQDRSTGPAVSSIIVITLLTTLVGLFEEQVRRPTKTMRRLTAFAYIVAAFIIAGRLTGWIPVP